MDQMKDFFTRSKWSKVDLFAAVAATGFLIWAVSPKLFPASQFIQLHEVRFGDSGVGETIPQHADRTVYQHTGRAYYEVDVLSANTGFRECYAKRHVPYAVNKRAVLPDRPEITGKSLKWWAYSDDGECQRWKSHAGRFYVKTRHCWKRFWWARTSCNPWHISKPFEVS